LKKRLMMALTAGALLAAMLPGMATPVAAAGKVTCQGQVATIVGTKDPDVIYGTSGPDVIAGLGGNDRISGRGGNDIICGGGGADRITGGAGLDRLYGNAGPDRLYGNAGPDRLYGGLGDDVLAGQGGNDHLNGMAGTDTCYQNAGTGPLRSCERPDSDGDGIADHADACPARGDQGWGVDTTGCPNSPVSIGYSQAAPPYDWAAAMTWSGLEPGSVVFVSWGYGIGTVALDLTGLNGTGTGSGNFSYYCTHLGTSLVSAVVTATPAGGDEQNYAAPLPDGSICP
jgi:hypothetical protein